MARPPIDDDTKRRVHELAAEIDRESFPFSSHQEALRIVLDYVESTHGKRVEESEPEFTLGESSRSQGSRDGWI